MKKTIMIMALATISISAKAQKVSSLPKPSSEIIQIDPKTNSKIVTKWVFDIKKLPYSSSYIKDLTSNLKITLEVKDDVNYGKSLYFYSTLPVKKIDISFNKNQTSSSSYNENTKTGYFHLESPLYKIGLKGGYRLLFYINGIPGPIIEATAIPLTIIK